MNVCVTTAEALRILCFLIGLLLGPDHEETFILDDDDPNVHSADRKCLASPGPKKKSTIVFQDQPDGHTRRLWEMPGWTDVAYLSDDCDYYARGYRHFDALPVNHRHDQPMIWFYRRGTLVGTVHLDDIIKDERRMRRNGSRLFWGVLVGFIAPHEFAADTVDGRRIVFDATNGNRLRDTPRTGRIGQ